MIVFKIQVRKVWYSQVNNFMQPKTKQACLIFNFIKFLTVVLVTGASSGLGEELAKAFYQHGAKVSLGKN